MGDNDKILAENLLDDDILMGVNGGTNAKVTSNLLQDAKAKKKQKNEKTLFSGGTNRKAGKLFEKDDKFKEITEKGTWC